MKLSRATNKCIETLVRNNNVKIQSAVDSHEELKFLCDIKDDNDIREEYYHNAVDDLLDYYNLWKGIFGNYKAKVDGLRYALKEMYSNHFKYEQVKAEQSFFNKNG